VILEVQNLRAGYDHHEVLKGVTIAVGEAEIVALIGPNGSGKSTLFKAVCGLLRPVIGTIRFLGHDIEKAGAEDILRKGLGYVPQGRRVFPSLTVDENLDLGGSLLRSKPAVVKRKAEIYERFPTLKGKAKNLAAELSGGQQQILGVARAMMLSPWLMLLDEPSLGVDPKTLGTIFETVKQLKTEGTSLFIIEQNVRSALAGADRIYLLDTGNIVAEGSPSEIARRLGSL
jgi:branched-chain amino acid transport system ATP-binding protein